MFSITPRTPNRATLKPDKDGSYAGKNTFPLDGLKNFIHWILHDLPLQGWPAFIVYFLFAGKL
ncbi:protein of unknown function [Shewanella benthica]|uniref:Uncharacterized protein n=1 Tax=Shewanella benthica TaxID=43661 RepID=A0A330M9U6_9GAMM|nr:protein of unknown function [Shewanella benthica]